MDQLPRDIADLCGIQMDRSVPALVARDTSPPSLSLTKGDDEVYTLTYRDREIGWINTVTLDRKEGHTYRAVSATGMVKHCWSLTLAKTFLIETAI